MAQNAKNWRVLAAILVTALFTVLWQNCSEIGFETLPSGAISKVGGLEVAVPPPGPRPAQEETVVVVPENDYNVPGEEQSETGEDGESVDEGEDGVVARACNIDIKDIVVNVQFIAGEANRHNPLVSSETGEVSLMRLVSEGILVKSLADIKTSQVRLVFNEGGHYILGADGVKHELLTSSHEEAGFRLRLTEGRVDLAAGQQYRLKADALPEIKAQEKGCRLFPNWRDLSLTAVAVSD